MMPVESSTAERPFACRIFESAMSHGWPGMFAVTVPANGAALIRLPHAALDEVTEGGVALAAAAGCTDPRQDRIDTVVELGAGEYVFVYPISPVV